MYPYYFIPSNIGDARQMVAGIENYSGFLSNLRTAINDEAFAVRFYQQLMDMAPDSKQRDFIKHAHEEEITHFKMFTDLYQRLTGDEATVKVTESTVTDYKAGILDAFERELEAADLYQEMYLSVQSPEIRDIFFKAMTDEMEHATRFSFLYNLR